MRIISAVLFLFALLPVSAPARDYIEVQPDALSRRPELYVGVPIKLKCRFVNIDSTWLNDREVFRSSRDYVGFAVEAGERIFAHLFLPADRKEMISRLRRNDRLIIYGQVFSARYDFAWIDIDKISEGWVVGEEEPEIRQERVEAGRDYEEFLQARARLLRELRYDEARELFYRQEALINLLIEKGVISRQDFDQALKQSKEGTAPLPIWDIILGEQP